MVFDVIVPTYNRAELLKKALDSLSRAVVPEGVEIRVTVVDNNSTDDTREIVASSLPRWGGRLHYLHEPTQGKSFALNRGIKATNGDLVGFIDDDEEVDLNWFTIACDTFKRYELDFIGGPYKLNLGTALPEWLSPRWALVFSGFDLDHEENYEKGRRGMLMGGNAVLTRAILDTVGGYSTDLGPSKANRWTGAEDDEMFRRLLEARARGRFIPTLIIYHNIPPERLTKKHIRQLVFWRAVTWGTLDRDYLRTHSQSLRVSIERYKWAAWAFLALLRHPLASPAQRFSYELELRHFAGFWYGMHFYSR